MTKLQVRLGPNVFSHTIFPLKEYHYISRRSYWRNPTAYIYIGLTNDMVRCLGLSALFFCLGKGQVIISFCLSFPKSF